MLAAWCGLVVSIYERRRVRYELADPGLGDALTALLGVAITPDPAVCADASIEGCC